MPRKKNKSIIETRCKDDWLKLSDQWIFNERDRNMFKRKMIDGITFEALSNEFELSVRRCQDIIDKSIKTLLKHI